MSAKRTQFLSDRLCLIARADSFHDSREPSFQIGHRVQLNSGSPPGLVVNSEDNVVTVAWEASEADFPASCLHRAH
jgi:hypothetical protein